MTKMKSLSSKFKFIEIPLFMQTPFLVSFRIWWSTNKKQVKQVTSKAFILK